MKKLIIGSVAVAAVIALRPVVKRRMVQRMREHCEQMAAKCRQMMAAQSGSGGDAVGTTMGPKVREHCEQMAAQHGGPGEPVATA